MERNEVMYEEDGATEVAENNDETRSGSGIVGKLIGGLIVAGLAAGAVKLWKKTAPKREAKAIKKLEKKGYVIYKTEEDENCVCEAEFEDVTEK